MAAVIAGGASGIRRRLLPLRYSIWTFIDVKRLALLTPKYVFTLSGRLSSFGVKFRDPLQLPSAIRVFGIICRHIAYSLPWRFRLHSAILLDRIITIPTSACREARQNNSCLSGLPASQPLPILRP